MIKINIKKVNNYYQEISFKGHALYDDYGKDIVCAAVSSISTTTINGILTIDSESIKYKTIKDGLIINDISDDDITQKLIENMVNLLKDLEENFPKNIEVK